MGKMHRFDEAHTIHGKSPEECFDYVADPDNGTKWASAASEITAEGEPGVGRTFKAKAGILGVGIDAVQKVTIFDRPSHYAYEGSTPFHVGYDFLFTADGDDTKMAATIEVDPGKFFPVGGFIVARTIKKMAEGDMKTLAKLMESEG